jgi:hypothetical protein
VAHPDGDAVAEQAITGNLEHFRFYSNHEDALSFHAVPDAKPQRSFAGIADTGDHACFVIRIDGRERAG